MNCVSFYSRVERTMYNVMILIEIFLVMSPHHPTSF